MKKREKTPKKVLGKFLCAVGILCLTGCGQSPQRATAPSASAAATETAVSEQEASDGQDMECIGGFVLKSKEFSSLLNADLMTFTHEKSGAQLVCIKNDDPELGFGVFYHTPYVDETDTNHIFEHAIISGSRKYPSKDVFFDMISKSYHTNINAFTYNTFTGYPVASQSQEQLMKLADVYLSCMVQPDILTNENIFKREALRYELHDKDDPITMSGTVFSEDFGYLTNADQESVRNISRALFPDTYAANAIGYLHHNYRELTYEKTLETYERCYHFDNSVIMLYGDVDYVPFMEFIDSEYLSKAERDGTDLSPYEDKETAPGYEKQTLPSPAYEGDTAEDASIVTYGIDLSQSSWNDLIGYEFLADILSDENGPLKKRLVNAGIYEESSCGVNYFCALPYFSGRLNNGNEDQAEQYQVCVQDALKEISEQGIDKELADTLLKSRQVGGYMVRDSSDVAFNVFPMIANYWTHTGETDYYVVYEQVLKGLEEDAGQDILKGLAGSLLNPRRSALVTTVPTPGLAEQKEQDMENYLAEMKASMTEDEIEALISDTEAFDTWNKTELSNNDFMIEPEQLPELKAYDSYKKEEGDGIVTYAADVDIEKTGSYVLYLDSSEIPKEDLPYLALYVDLIGEMDTASYSKEELQKKTADCIFGSSISYLHPLKTSGENYHPMVKYAWKGLTEDYTASLEILLEMMENTRFDNAQQMISALSKSIDSYDCSRPQDPLSLARDRAAGAVSESYAYRNAVNSQDTYKALKKILDELETNPDSVNRVAEKLNHVGELLMQRGTVIFCAAAGGAEAEHIVSLTRDRLKDLPENTSHTPSLTLEPSPALSAYIIESPNQTSVLVADTGAVPGLSGHYVSFFSAVNDRYLIPMLRFQMTAYSAGGSINLNSGYLMAYSFSDPNVGKTLEVLRGFADDLETAHITEADLKGYILSAFATADRPAGVMEKPLQSIEMIICGYDLDQSAKLANEIKTTSLTDQKAAADYFKKLLAQSSMATVGNETAIRSEADIFDQVTDYRKSTAESE